VEVEERSCISGSISLVATKRIEFAIIGNKVFRI